MEKFIPGFNELTNATISTIIANYIVKYLKKIPYKKLLFKLKQCLSTNNYNLRDLKIQLNTLSPIFMKRFNIFADLALTGALIISIGIGSIILHLGIGAEKNIYLTTILAASIPLAVYIPRKMLLNDNF